MLNNYLKIAWREIIRNKVSIINIGDLTVGMTVAILIGLWIYDEFSFNKYHKNYSGIVRLMERAIVNGEVKTGKYLSMPVAPELRKYTSDFRHVGRLSFVEEHTLANGEAKIILSCCFAIPIAYHYLHEWLQKYEYCTEISWWIFAVAIGGALFITLLTVSFQAVKAAIANPVKSLRTE